MLSQGRFPQAVRTILYFSSSVSPHRRVFDGMIESAPNPSPLAERLRARIKREGAITFRDWMEAALYDARDGYYCRPDRKRWGRAGDYRTAPERSPLFAATFARYFARWYDEL